ncbi:MAG: hypothetical protein KKB51_04905 [Candidatus Riflebacteria bacterium]|nr:hypothetical protein [Candidatus Riflebacteria bacterium]
MAEFVKNGIALEPYSGILRGPAGTIAARTGNDWDRAALPHALLASAGYRSRFLVIERTEDEMRTAIKEFLQRRNTCKVYELDLPVSEKELPPPSAIFRQFRFSQQNRILLAEKNAENWRQTLNQAGDIVATTASEAEAILFKTGFTEVPDFEEWHGRLLGKVRQTVLVELLDIDFPKTFCLDPLMAEITQERLAETEVFEEIPEELRAKLVMRIILQTGTPDALQDKTILEHAQFAGTLFHQPIQLQISPVYEHPEKKPAQTWTPEEWAANLAGFSKFQAVLYLNEKMMTSEIFDLSGKISITTSDPNVDNAGQIGDANQGLWGGMFTENEGDSDKESDSEPTVLEAILFELEMAIPDEGPILQRCILYGRLRNEVSPVCSIDLLVNEGPIRPNITAWMALEAFAVNTPVLTSTIRSIDPHRFEEAQGFQRFPQMLHNWLTGRIALANRMLQQNQDLAWLPGPSCIMKAVSLKVASGSKEVSTEVALDVAFDLQTLFPRDEAAAKKAFSANIALGFAETALEAVLLGQKNPGAATGGPVADWLAARVAGEKPSVFPPDFAVEDIKDNFTDLAQQAIVEHEGGKLLIRPFTDRFSSLSRRKESFRKNELSYKN